MSTPPPMPQSGRASLRTPRIAAARLAVVAGLLATGLACQAPFGTARQDLVGDRIAAMAVDVLPGADDGLRPHTWLVVDGHPWSDVRPTWAWYWLDPDDPDIDGVSPTVTPDALGPAPRLPLPTEDAVLGLVLTFPDGTQSRATLEVPAFGPTQLPPLDTLQVQRVPGLSLASTEDDLAREARLDAPAEDLSAADPLQPGQWARLNARFAYEGEVDTDRLTRVRWMQVGTPGTFLELTEDTTDWSAARLTLDDLEIEEATETPEGPVTILALALDDAGGQRVRAQELFVGPEPRLGARIGGRWIATDDVIDPEVFPYIEGTVVADDDAPTGLRLVDVVGRNPQSLPAGNPYLTDGLPCAAQVAGPFTPDWLFDGRCTRPDLEGRRVIGLLETP